MNLPAPSGIGGWLLAALAVGLGGAVGGVARFWVSEALARRLGTGFPWGTLTVNVSGSLLLGVLVGLLAGKLTGVASGDPASWWLLALGVGVLGSYTTVSSFSLQTVALWEGGYRRAALWHVGLSLVLCLGAVGLGLNLARLT